MEKTMTEDHLPSVSVVIPVYNDARRLKKCLRALENQTYIKTGYEVVVVDNGSKENIETIVKPFRQARLTYEASPGSYAARNKGISVSKGDIIAFTDSDCIPESEWISRGVKHLQRVQGCGLVAGKIEMFYQKAGAPNAVELYDKMFFLDQEKYIEQHHFAATANAFTCRDVIQKVGSFNDKLKSSGDSEWGQRIHAAGFKQIYADDAVVVHPARHKMRQIFNKVVRHTGGMYVREGNVFSIIRLIRDIGRLFPPFRYIIKLYFDSELAKVSKRYRIILIMLFVRYIRLFERIRLQLGGEPIR
jgi:glycosyltransferase involved in cell wall biosynthesis